MIVKLGSKYAPVLVVVMTMGSCQWKNDRFEHLINYAEYVRTSSEIDEEICRQSFVDGDVRDQAERCNALVFFSSVYKKRMREERVMIELVRATETTLDFGDALTEREVYRVIFNSSVTSDTSYLLVGDYGIKSCAMLMKGKRVLWLQ